MRLCPRCSPFLVPGLLAALTAAAQPIEYQLSKEQWNRQISATSVVTHSVHPTALNIRAATDVTVLAPSGVPQPALPSPVQGTAVRLERIFPSVAAMDAAYPNGTYRMLGLTIPDVSLDVSPGYPANGPQLVAVTNGSWNGNGILVVDRSAPVTLTFNSFSDYAAPGGVGYVRASLWGFSEQETIVAAESGSQTFSGLSGQTTPITSITIPADRLIERNVYEATIEFARIIGLNTTLLPGRESGAVFKRGVRFYLIPYTGGPTSPATTITAPPADRTVAAGGSTSLTANYTASSVGGTIVQWTRNGQEFIAQNSGRVVRSSDGRTITINPVLPADAGEYVVHLAGLGGIATSPPSTLTVTEPTPARALTSLSARVTIGSGSNAALASFLVESSTPKTILVRAVGPTLTGLGVAGALADPTLTVFDQTGTAIATNDDWGGTAALKQAFINAATFALGSDSSKDAALLLTANPGLYTMRVTGVAPATGVAVLEVFDLDSAPRLAYLATRATTGPGEATHTAGFVNPGTTTQNVLIRALGPALDSAGVTGALADPTLSVFRGSTPLGTNNDWDGAAIADAATTAGLMPLVAGSRDAALNLSLSQGIYAAQSPAGTTGIVQLEIAAIDNDRRASFRPALLEPPAATHSAPLGSRFTLTAPPLLAKPRTLAYQWRRNGVNIAGATASQFTLPIVQAADAGEYRVAITNSAGTTFSALMTVSIGPATIPVITAQPVSRPLVIGGSASFSVTAAGVAPLAYQWLFNGNPIAGATSATLTLDNLQAGQAGTYSVRVTNSLGSITSSGAGLSPVPVIANQPLSQSVMTGNPVTLAVIATSTAPLTYQWRKDGTNVAGATNATYPIPSAQPTHAGTYTVVVTNTAGTVTSTAATLTVTRNYAGSYFGTFAGGAGNWALVVRSDGIGTYVAYLNNPRGGIIATVIVAPDGTFRTTSVLIQSGAVTQSIGGRPVAAAGPEIVLSGTIGTTTVTGSLEGVGVTFSGSLEAPNGDTAAVSGIYQSSGSGTTTYTVVGSNRQVVALTVGTTTVDGGIGSAGGSGAFTVTTTNNTQVTGTASTSGTITTTVTPASGQPVTTTGTITTGLGPPTVAPVAASRTVAFGSALSLPLAAGGRSPLSFQWKRNGIDVPGATTGAYTVAAAQFTDAGNYSCVVTNAEGTLTTPAIAVTVVAPNANFPTARLVNLSIRTDVRTPGDNFTLGYVVGGDGTAGPKPFVIRAVGPSLAALGVSGTLDDPRLELFAGATKRGENDDWGGIEDLAAAFRNVGAFGFSAATSRDAAVLDSVVTTQNSVKVSAAGNGTGEVIAEIYDAASADPTAPRLINVSVLKHLGTGLTAGFVIGGTGTRNVLIRAVGPTLATAFNLDGVVADPQLTLYSGATVVRSNDNWGGSPEIAAAFSAVGAFTLPAGSRDAALLAALQPGAYTVQVSGVNNSSGIAIVEVYEAP